MRLTMRLPMRLPRRLPLRILRWFGVSSLLYELIFRYGIDSIFSRLTFACIALHYDTSYFHSCSSKDQRIQR
jgi:hypothetical protein